MKVITKNDVWRFIGMAMIIGGQFTSKQTLTTDWFTFDLNFIQVCGVVLFLYPIVIKSYLAIKEKRMVSTKDIKDTDNMPIVEDK